MKIIIKNCIARWCKISENYIRGYAYLNNKLFLEQQLYELILSAIKKGTLSNILEQLNGNFSMIIHEGNDTYLISDKIRSYPLLYIKNKDSWFISDTAKGLLEDEAINLNIDENSILEFIPLRYVSGKNTLISDCFTVPSGKYVILNGNATEYSYYSFIYEKIDISNSEIIRQSAMIFENSVERMLRTIKGRQIAIPLSGGYDSRAIACVCKKMRLENVICYSLGLKGSLEVETSKKVAGQLGFPWYFIEYDKEKWLKLYESEEYCNYSLFANNFNTVPGSLDFIAIKELLENNVITNNTVVVPGHSADALCGSHIVDIKLDINQSYFSYIYKNHFNMNELKSFYKRLLESNFNAENRIFYPRTSKDQGFIDEVENWDFKNRQSHLIINQVRIYDYFNLDWRVPFWDDEFVEFWLSVNRSFDKYSLYLDFVFEKYFEPYNVAFKKTTGSRTSIFAKIPIKSYYKQAFKQLLSHLPFFAKRFYENGSFETFDYLKRKTKRFKCPYLLRKPNTTASIVIIRQLQLLQELLFNRK